MKLPCKKVGFWAEKNLKNSLTRDRTRDLPVMSSPTRPLLQKNLLKNVAKSNASSSLCIFASLSLHFWHLPEGREFQTFKFSKFWDHLGSAGYKQGVQTLLICAQGAPRYSWRVFFFILVIFTFKVVEIASPNVDGSNRV